MSTRFVGLLLVASCQCQPQPECTSSVECGGRPCVDGTCRARDGGAAVFVTSGGTAGGATTSGGVAGSAGGVVILDCQRDHTGTVTGTVYEPSGRLALPNVLVYVPSAPLDDLPAGPSGRCLGCEADISGVPLVSTLTSPTGTFVLENVPASTQTHLVFQTGRWRREVEVFVPECASRQLDRDVTRLPRSKSEGHLPKMALVTGAADPLECLLLKLGVDPSEFTRPDAGGAVHFYVDNGQLLAGGQPSGFEFFALGNFDAYDTILVPCRGNEYLMGSTIRQRVADYVDKGGRFFITHYGYTWMQGPPFSATAEWQPTSNGSPTDRVPVVTNFPRGAIYRQWLTSVAQLGSDILIVDARYNVGSVKGQTIEYLGVDGRRQLPADPHWTAQLSFTTPVGADAGCGRVAFSDFHVSTEAVRVPVICTTAPPCTPPPPFPDNCWASDFTDQEKVLVYILFDLGTCPRDDRGEPTACVALDGACSPRRGCCGDFRCLTPSGERCDGGSCVCSP